MTRLDVSDLSVTLGGRRVLDRVSLKVAAGEFVGLIGPNGAGKSTLLKAAMRLVAATGSVTLGGRDVDALAARERARLVAYLPQQRDVAWPIPAGSLVALGRAPHRPRFGPPTAHDEAVVEAAMARMDVGSFRDQPATDLSGGELARVLIARVLAQDTPLLLADEPTAGLDPSHQIALMRTFSELAGDGRSIVASLHDLGLAARWCTRLVLIDAGHIVADGAPLEVLTPARLRGVYGVEALFTSHAGGPIVHPYDLAARTGEGTP